MTVICTMRSYNWRKQMEITLIYTKIIAASDQRSTTNKLKPKLMKKKVYTTHQKQWAKKKKRKKRWQSQTDASQWSTFPLYIREPYMSNTQNPKPNTKNKKNMRHKHTNLMYALLAIWMFYTLFVPIVLASVWIMWKRLFFGHWPMLTLPDSRYSPWIMVLVNLFNTQIGCYAMPLILVPFRLAQYADDDIQMVIGVRSNSNA